MLPLGGLPRGPGAGGDLAPDLIVFLLEDLALGVELRVELGLDRTVALLGRADLGRRGPRQLGQCLLEAALLRLEAKPVPLFGLTLG